MDVNGHGLNNEGEGEGEEVVDVNDQTQRQLYQAVGMRDYIIVIIIAI